MEIPSKLLEQLAFNKKKPKNEEHMLIVTDKFLHENNLSQPLQIDNE